MAAISFTVHQTQAIEASGGSLLVSAAAGSGKTAVLTERVIRMLTGEVPVPADRLIIVTFTVAAAEEMRRRIGDRLAELIEQEPENEWLQNQQMLLPSARISTIHALCSSLIREHFELLGISGEISIADDAELAVLKREALEEILEAHYALAEKEFRDLVESVCVRDDRPLHSLILSVYDFIRSFSFPLEFLDQAEEFYRREDSVELCPWAPEVLGHLCSALRYGERRLGECLEEMASQPAVQEKYGPAFSSDLEQVQALYALGVSGRLSEAAELSRSMKKLSLKPVRKFEDAEFLDSLKQRRGEVWALLEELSSRYLFTNAEYQQDRAILLPRVTALFGLVRELYLRLEEKKQEAGRMDYADLEHYALRLLLEQTPDGPKKSAVAEELSAQYDEIMVDECQDINEIQNRIFSLLSCEGKNLFMVGDVKQSIYRFRKAMPALFIEKSRRFPSYDPAAPFPDGGAKIILGQNFRSRREVCGLVNFLFERLMSEEIGEIAYGEEEKLLPGAVYDAYPPSCPELHILDGGSETGTDRTLREAAYAAELIHSMVDSGYQVQGKQGLRQCGYGDFAILLRSHTSKAPVYAKALKAQNIPCHAASSEGYFDSYEVLIAVNLLRIIDNPLLDVPLLSVLLSPVCGFTADEVTEIRLAQKNVPLYRAMRQYAEEGSRHASDFLLFLQQLREKSALLRCSELIREIYDRTDFPALAYAMGDGVQKDANLRLLLTYAERYESFGEGGLAGFLRYLDRVQESGEDFSAANPASEAGGAVQILSIHASKGLEFPVCIVADCGKRFNKMDLIRPFQQNAALGFSMKITQRETLQSYSSLPFEAIRLRSEKELIAEEMRVLYVAMTRAREKLILLASLPNAAQTLRKLSYQASGGRLEPFESYLARGYEGWLLPVLLRHPDCGELRAQIGRPDLKPVPADFPLRAVWVPAGPEGEEGSKPDRVFFSEPDPVQVERLRQRFEYRYPFEELTRLPAKLTVTQIAKKAQEDGIHLDTRPAFLQAKGLTPAQRGTILHSFMQYADYEAAEQDLEAEINRLLQKQYLTQAEAEALNRKKIRAFFASPLYARMKSALRIQREYPFLYFLKAGEVDPTLSPDFAEEEILIQGIADCLIFEESGIVIVDYKTDYTSDESVLIAQYYDQLRIYKDAVEKAFGIPVRECLLYSLHLERSIRIPV